MSRRLKLLPPPPDREPAGEPSDDALMCAVAAGDRRAFAALVERHQPRVQAFVQAITRDPQLARDLAQEVFLRVWSTRAGYRPEGRFAAFVFTLARNFARSANRRRAIRALFGARPDPAEAGLGPVEPAEALLRTESIRLVAAGLERLPERFRVPLLLRFAEEMAYEDIARVIRRTPSAARSRVHYGLKALARLLPEEVSR
jgi:RNA polymerase sigma-70 factor (ECF subfamily)